MRRRRVLASLAGAIALLAAVLWFAERGWRNAQQTAETRTSSSPPAQQEIFSVTGPETVTRGEAQAPSAAPNQAPPVPPNVTASSPASESASRASRAASPQGVDARPLWRLMQERRHEELRAAIAAHRQAHPEWQPPSQLLELLNTAEADAEYQRHLNALAQAKVAGNTARALEEAAALAPLVEARRAPGGGRITMRDRMKPPRSGFPNRSNGRRVKRRRMALRWRVNGWAITMRRWRPRANMRIRRVWPRYCTMMRSRVHANDTRPATTTAANGPWPRRRDTANGIGVRGCCMRGISRSLGAMTRPAMCSPNSIAPHRTRRVRTVSCSVTERGAMMRRSRA